MQKTRKAIYEFFFGRALRSGYPLQSIIARNEAINLPDCFVTRNDRISTFIPHATCEDKIMKQIIKK